MTSERVQRQIDRFLDEAEAAMAQSDWTIARDRALNVLALDPENKDARSYLDASDRRLGGTAPSTVSEGLRPRGRAQESAPPSQPISFVDGRYQVRKFLGEGGKKKVYLAHDNTLDRDVAFALIKTEGLDEIARQRITNEAQAMGRLGDHPNIVTVFDVGLERDGQPYMVLPLMAGGDVEGLIEKAEEHKLPLDLALQISREVCLGLGFAHEKGVIHRDLKPGNVWLTGDPAPRRRGAARGVAKIGDFGLAVALDRSRLTQVGMMVGTVSYMPPEQAMGGDVSAQSDLYSLGAMLYEMVTGRPPFVGDDSVAIISQHLNTPPVAPTWHRPDCPPGLEALILRLLEKDASKRPASAAEVREALTAVDLRTATASAGIVAPAGIENPLYQGTFVGREPELKQLREAFDASLSGRGALMMVVGEPGIGKTALCEQLATYVAVRGGRTLVGHCYEEGSLSLPYLAFVEALRTYVLARDPDGLKSDLGSNGPEVARIVSEVRERANVEPRSTSGDPEEERWRLLQAVTSFLRSASSVQPLLIVLEDLHWADRGTLDLLLHLARNLQGARLLVVGTYRDVEVDRAHPLSATLAELRRSSALPRVALRGLTIDEVHRMMNIIRGQEVPWSRAEAIHRQTEGNPLFVQEVLRFIVEEGLVVREDGRYVASEEYTEDRIPEGLRDVIGRRLSHLAEKTNQVLSIAAVIGREFRLDVLQRVSGLPEAEVEAAVKEAGERAIVEQRSSVGVLNFRFTHAFFRQTLYEEIFASQRLRLHQQVARGLETVYGRRLEEHASELAEHFAQSTDHADFEKALSYSELAAKRAMSVFAYGEAVRHLEQSLKIQDVLDPDDKLRRCDLLLALSAAMLPMEEPRRVADTVAAEAFGLAEALADALRAARAAVQAIEAFQRAEGGPGAWRRSPEFTEWVARADRHAKEGTADRIYADLGQFTHANATAGPAPSHVFLRRALDRAIDLEDSAPFFAAAGQALTGMTALGDRELIDRVVREVVIRSHDGVRARDLGACLFSVVYALLSHGDRAGAESAWRELEQLAERSRDATNAIQALAGPIVLAFLDGRLEEALSLHEARLARGRELGVGAPGLQKAPVLLGRAAGYLHEWEDPGRPTQARRAVLLAHLGRYDEVRAIRASFGDVGSDHDESGLHVLVDLLEAAVLCQDAETAGALMRRLKPLTTEAFFNGNGGLGVSIGRLCGGAAKLLGQPDEARGYYDQGLEFCAKIRFRPETALIRLELAELLLEHYSDERAVAIEHLDFAIGEFREMKMQPSLERALRHRELLKA